MNDNDDNIDSVSDDFSADSQEGMVHPVREVTSWREHDEKLRKMWIQGLSQYDIAKELDRSPAAVMTRAARLGLPRRMSAGRKIGGKNAPKSNPNKVPHHKYTYKKSAVKKEEQPEIEYIERICLMCLKKFTSEGRFNRICPSCKASSEYHRASSLSEIQLGTI